MRTRSLWSWLACRQEPVPLLPARPPDGPDAGPAPDPADPVAPLRPVRAVCCSGGGIRAAAFALGGLQGLGRRRAGRASWLEGVDLVTAVSGGSYIASSYAMVQHGLGGRPGCDPLPPYAPGSPEDARLRAHTRYLVEGKKVAAVGVLSIVYGLVLNLLPILAGLYAGGTLLGWGLRSLRVVRAGTGADRDRWQAVPSGAVVGVVVVAGAVGFALFAADRLLDVYLPPSRRRSEVLRTWTLRLLALALAVLVLGVVVPALLVAASGTDALHRGPADWPTQLAGLVTTSLTLVGLVKASLGRFRGRLQARLGPGRSGLVATVAGRTLRLLAPWAGSAVALAMLVVAFVTWVSTAAYSGPHRAGLLSVAGALAGLFLWQLLTDVNRNSVHPFYLERITEAFAVRRSADGRSVVRADSDGPVRFSEYADDAPALVVCAAVNTEQTGAVPAGRGCAPFTFSGRRSGVSSGQMFRGEAAPGAPHGMVDTELFEQAAGVRLMTLPGAVAVSGAAVSPVMGRSTRAPLRLLLGLANVRLGLWLPNPLRPDLLQPAPGPGRRAVLATLRHQLGQPGMRALLTELLGGTRLDGRWVYVTDGGHYENLGLVEALRRGATEIVAFDASGDPPDSWVTFGEAIETARTDLGVEIDLDPSGMRAADGGRHAPTLVVQGTCTYANGVTARLYLCKLALPAEASWDVFAWAHGHPTFPHDSTGQQLYGDREFEAYRRLGEIAATAARALLEPAARIDLTDAVPAQEQYDVTITVPLPPTVAAGRDWQVRGTVTRHEG